MHGKDATVLIDLLWFNVVHYSSLFQYFFDLLWSLYSSWKLQIFFGVFVNFLKMNMVMIEIQYSDIALLLLVNPYIPHQNNGTACPLTYRLKRRCFIASYVQPVMQQYKSTTVKKSFWNQSNHYENFHYKWIHHVPTTKEGCGKSIKNALHVQQYGKRHLLGWSNVKQWKNQAFSLSHCLVTWIWRHQAVS